MRLMVGSPTYCALRHPRAGDSQDKWVGSGDETNVERDGGGEWGGSGQTHWVQGPVYFGEPRRPLVAAEGLVIDTQRAREGDGWRIWGSSAV